MRAAWVQRKSICRLRAPKSRGRVDPLAGSLRHTPGIIALVVLACERGLDTGYVPASDAREATLLGSSG